ncbi:ATP synthase subunit I [Paenibacillus lentus]|uniref:ATP synthase subunit I n=1 Tax=Paenibacillus lentus TaxID=1338368 RepID=A0A3Q8S478_9BACL|nr:ATP synthase subunit I [Paenibacillus lentus]AZK45865.1 ATP synthase subunit I [Paenibacillus lentus]
MDDLGSIVKAVFRITFLLLFALLFGWAVLPEYRPILAGFVLGLAIGLIYVRFLSFKVRQFIQLVVSEEQRKFSFGFITRICLVFIAVMVAVKFEQVSLITVIIGIFVPQLLTIPVSIFIGIRNKA